MTMAHVDNERPMSNGCENNGDTMLEPMDLSAPVCIFDHFCVSIFWGPICGVSGYWYTMACTACCVVPTLTLVRNLFPWCGLPCFNATFHTKRASCSWVLSDKLLLTGIFHQLRECSKSLLFQPSIIVWENDWKKLSCLAHGPEIRELCIRSASFVS